MPEIPANQPARPRLKTARGGIDLGGTKIQTVVVDDAGAVLGAARRPTPDRGGPATVIAAMAETLAEAAHAAALETSQLAGTGVGSPGTVDSETGVVAEAGNLPGWEGSFPMGHELAHALGTRVVVGNDVQVATEAEYALGAGRGFSSLLGVFWGTGVGGGLILDGRPWHGRGAAGELGHMVVKIGGRRCTCGRDGCMEAYAGRAAMEIRARARVAHGASTDLFKIMEERGRTRLTSGIWARALERDDKLAKHMIERAVQAIAAAVASAVNLLDIEAVVIGGGLGVRLGEPYVQRIAAAMQPHLFVDARPPQVRLAELGDLGGAIGAAMLAR